MELIVLYGPPGVGKLTVAREIANINGYKVFHNHLTFDLVRELFDVGAPEFGPLVTRLRLDLIEAAAKAEIPGLIFTFVYGYGPDDEFMQQLIDRVRQHGGIVKLVLLTTDDETILIRGTDPSRAAFEKLRDEQGLKQLLADWELNRPFPHAPSLVIDNTAVSPVEAAERIVAWSGTQAER